MNLSQDRRRSGRFTISRLLTSLAVAVSALAVSIPATSSEVHRAEAAPIGSGSCASNVDSATGVSTQTAPNGDCVVSFATAPTTGTSNGATETRTWTVPSGVSAVDVLVVAGGGGGGSSHGCCPSGGAGGGGGVVVATNFSVTPGALITVRTGLGGNGTYCGNGFAGGNSAFGTLLAIGGGRGQGCGTTASPGGSGGGSHYQASGGPSTQSTSGTPSNGSNITAYGRAGGGSTNYNGGGGGGGGATQAGGAGGSNFGGAGGEGIANSFRTNSPIVYGSGGGGQGSSAHGAGGTNGGRGSGNSGFGGTGINGVNETGAGGGGGWTNSSNGQPAGRGGTGIVVVRYSAIPKLATPSSISATATPLRGKSINVSWAEVPNAVAYEVKIKATDCTTQFGIRSGISGTTVTVDRFYMASFAMGDSTSYGVSVRAIGDGGLFASSAESTCTLVTTNGAVAIPTISTDLISINKTVGQTAVLSVTATTTDAGTLSYQWMKAGVAITNATASSYSINSVSPEDAGVYKVEITNTLGSGLAISTVSGSATLTVASALAITTPIAGLTGTADSSFSLSVAATGGRAALTYSLTGTLVNGLSLNTLSGTISGTPTVSGSSTVSVTVTDANNATATTSNFTISIGYASTSVSLSLANPSPQYRTTNRITATTSRAGTVNFMLNSISIPGCESVSATSTATCDWIPVDLGSAALSATFTPMSSAAYSNSTASLNATVGGRAITITPTFGQSKVFGDSEPVISYSITSGSLYGLDILTGALSRVQGEDAGTYSITGGTLSNANYAITLAPVNFTITKTTQAPVLLTTTNGVFATELILGASGGSGPGAYSYAVISAGSAGCSIWDDVLSTSSTGTCTVVATRAASTNYVIASSGVTTVTIIKATQSAISLISTSGTYNTNLSLAAIGGDGSGMYSFSVSDAGTAGCSLAMGPSLTSSSAGSCTVTVTRVGDNNYESRLSVATLVTFAKDTQNALTLRDNSGDLDSGITLSVSGGSGTGTVSYSVSSGSANCSITSGVVNARFAGTCSLTTVKAADVNYLQRQITNTLTFVKATQSSLQVTSTSGSYGTPIQLSTTGGSGSGSVSYVVSDNGSASCVMNGTQLTFTSAGSCKVTATRDADNVFDSRSSASTTITIDRINQTPLAVSTSTGDLLSGIIVAVTGGGGTGSVSTSVTQGTANCSLTAGLVTARSTGVCSLSISKSGDTNFLSASATVTLTFTKATPSLGTVASPTSSALGTGITLAYTGGTGNGSVTYALVSSGSAGCSITNGVLNATSGGKCSVIITKRGDDTYADQVTTSEFTFVDNRVASTSSTSSTTSTTIVGATSTDVVVPKVSTTTSTTSTTSTVPTRQAQPPSLVNTASAAGSATIGGKTIEAKTTRVDNQLVFTVGNFTVTLAGVNADGSVIPLSADGSLKVGRGDDIRLNTQGFAPDSEVDIWMFSTPLLLAKIKVGADGLLKSNLKIPKSVDDGLHHLVMVGTDRDNADAKIEMGMNVGVPPKQWWYSRILIVIPISIAVFLGFWLPTSGSRRRRRRLLA